MSLDTTIKALQGGLTELGVAKGVKNIDSWMETLETADFRGSKIIHENLGKLKAIWKPKRPTARPSVSCCRRSAKKPRVPQATTPKMPRARRSVNWRNCSAARAAV